MKTKKMTKVLQALNSIMSLHTITQATQKADSAFQAKAVPIFFTGQMKQVPLRVTQVLLRLQ